MKLCLVACAAALLAVPQAAQAAEPLCDRLAAFAASQWSEPSDPLPRHWVEFHWGFQTEVSNGWAWACRDSGDEASGQFCDWLMANSSRGFQAALPFALLRCMDDQSVEPAAATDALLLDGEVRRRMSDGSWVVLEISSNTFGIGGNAVRVSLDSDDRTLEPEDLPAIRPYAPEPEQPRVE